MDTKSKGNIKYFLIFIIGVYSLAISLFSLNNVIINKQYIGKPYFSSQKFEKEIVNAFYCVIGKNSKEDLEGLDVKRGLKYYLKFNDSGEVKSNLENPKNLDRGIEKSLYTIKFPIENPKNVAYENISDYFKEKNCSCYFMVLKEEYIIESYPILFFYDKFQTVNRDVAISIVCLIVGILSILYLKKKDRLDIKYVKKIYFKYSQMYLEFKVLLFIIFTAIVHLHTQYPVYYRSFSYEEYFHITIAAVYVLYLFINGYELKKIIKNSKYRDKQFNNSFIKTVSKILKKSYIYKSVLFKVVVFSIMTATISSVILASYYFACHEENTLFLCLIYLMVYFFGVVPLVLKKIGKFNKIVEGADKIASGDFNFIINTNNKGILGKLADDINNIKNGYKEAIKNGIKSENFKGELITNVSHDLKTPLTSIINYIKLLQKDDLSREEIDGYISVLDRKSERLKSLIEDLFEVSKMSSGAVKFNIERLNVVSLLKQSLAEFDERINKSSLHFKVKYDKDEIYANLDGKRTWRVFENLISNILKYSEDNTRVYIDLKEIDNKAIITMKNISNYEMNFDVDEIFERFKRGDKSRTTEGSGLGLAIADSIINNQGGDMKIFVDGDLFKVIIKFNLDNSED